MTKERHYLMKERHYLEKAERCLLLAETSTDPDVAAVMHRLSCDYRDLATEELIRALARQPVLEQIEDVPDKNG
jgi:hypothetical protein